MGLDTVTFPHASTLIVDGGGRLTREGLRFLDALWRRAGSDFVTNPELIATLEDYPTEAEAAAALAAALTIYVTTTTLTTSLASYTTTTALNALLTAYAKLAGGNSFTGAQTVAFVTLTDGATINTDASLSNNFFVTLGGNRTLANPTLMRDGGVYNWYIKQDGTGSRTLAYGSKFKFSGSSTVSTAASSRDLIVGIYHAGDDVVLATLTKGFA